MHNGSAAAASHLSPALFLAPSPLLALTGAPPPSSVAQLHSPALAPTFFFFFSFPTLSSSSPLVMLSYVLNSCLYLFSSFVLFVFLLSFFFLSWLGWMWTAWKRGGISMLKAKAGSGRQGRETQDLGREIRK